MTDTIHITEDDEPFMIQQAAVDKQLAEIREKNDKVSLITICIECGESIGEARKKAVPSTNHCIFCAELNDKYR